MKNQLKTQTLIAFLGTVFAAEINAQVNAFTYQGRLTKNGSPADGVYDLRFTLYESSDGPTIVGGPVTNNAITVSGGLFAVTMDFGAGVFNGGHRWLEIAAVTNGGGAFTIVSPRQQITSVPYAVTAGNLSGPLPAGGLSGTYTEAVTLNNAANSFTGSFSGDGAGMVNVDAARLEGMGMDDFWQLGGNAGTTEGIHFLGTTDDQSFDIRVKNHRGLRIESPTIGSVPNLIGGCEENAIGSGTQGSIIAGGGFFGYANSLGTNSLYSTISGGYDNEIAHNASFATVSGGRENGVGANAWYAFAAGRRAQANHPGTFVWADSADADFASTGNNQFLIRASGGVGIGATNPAARLTVAGAGPFNNLYAAAAVQELNREVEQQRAENAELKARLEKLEQLLNTSNGGRR